MNIVCATDNNFVQHCSIMLVSLLEHNPDASIYVLTEGLSDTNYEIIRSEVERYNAPIEFIQINSDLINSFPMPDIVGLNHISRATYYRILIAELLPISMDKVIYLDCDIIINDSLDQLWNIDLTNYAIAASKQIGCGFEAARLGYPIEYGYFNAGMNVINLNYFRENKIADKLIEYLRDNYEKIKFHDQDALNGVLYNRTLHVLPQWNMTSIAYSMDLNRRGDRKEGDLVCDYQLDKENVKKYKKCPPVLHYVSRPKPWNKRCIHPLYSIYYKYAAKSIHFKNIKSESYFRRAPYIFSNFIRELLSCIKQRIIKSDPSRN